jgi:hypothetical protein
MTFGATLALKGAIETYHPGNWKAGYQVSTKICVGCHTAVKEFEAWLLMQRLNQEIDSLGEKELPIYCYCKMMIFTGLPTNILLDGIRHSLNACYQEPKEVQDNPMFDPELHRRFLKK